jgi:hypothetical protein
MKIFMQTHFLKNIPSLNNSLSWIFLVKSFTGLIFTEQHKSFHPTGAFEAPICRVTCPPSRAAQARRAGQELAVA